MASILVQNDGDFSVAFRVQRARDVDFVVSADVCISASGGYLSSVKITGRLRIGDAVSDFSAVLDVLEHGDFFEMEIAGEKSTASRTDGSGYRWDGDIAAADAAEFAVDVANDIINAGAISPECLNDIDALVMRVVSM